MTALSRDGGLMITVPSEWGEYGWEIRTLCGKSIMRRESNETRRHVNSDRVEFDTYAVGIRAGKRTVFRKITVP